MRNEIDVTESRLHGLDLARYAALVGMVIVNFDVVMVHGDSISSGSSYLAEALRGRAAAVFVVLAGIGLGLAGSRSTWRQMFTVTVKRAAFLLVLGLLNTLVFSADIIHYYAVYFLLAVLVIHAKDAVLWLVIVTLVFGFVGLTGVIDYESGWNWQTLTYVDFWTPSGFVRNLFFNGWHPVVPWLAYLLFGIWLSRRELRAPSVQTRLFLGGTTVLVITTVASHWLTTNFGAGDEELSALLGTDPTPPMPLYMIAGGSAACLVVGLCLRVATLVGSTPILVLLNSAGRQTLTLYIAHIFVGMGTLEALGMIGGQSSQRALVAALLFCLAATAFAFAWSRRFKRGSLESLMRRVSA